MLLLFETLICNEFVLSMLSFCSSSVDVGIGWGCGFVYICICHLAALSI